MIRASVKPELLRWARERAKVTQECLAAKFKKLPMWEAGQERPTLKQVETFARAVHAPVGYLFLSEPPKESLPIPDFRTFADHAVTRPSPNLLDTIYACQGRQSWYRDFAHVTSGSDLDFVGSASIKESPETVATRMREILAFDLPVRRECPTWGDALQRLVRQADKAGILIMMSGVVASNNHRRLDPTEFLGFALCDPLAPLVFINGTDAKEKRMLTLAHELAHIWLGASALSNLGGTPNVESCREEMWCDSVAAEFLVPLRALRSDLRRNEPLPDELFRLAHTFKVSKSIVLRRLLDAGWLTRERFDAACARENECLRMPIRTGGSGGSGFHRTTIARVGHRFARSLVASTLEGHTLYRDAFRMLGIRKAKTFDDLVREIAVMG